MLDRNTSDRLNPVFIRLMRELMRTRIIMGVCILTAVFSLCVAYLLSSSPEDAEMLGGFVSLCIPVCLLCSGGNVVMHVHRARNVDGMDPGLGTTLSPWRIMAGQLQAMLAACAIPLVCAIPIICLCRHLNCISYKGVAVSASWAFIILVLLMAALQFNAGGKNLSPLWICFALAICPPAMGLIFVMPLVMANSHEADTCFYLFVQAWAAISLLVLAGAAIYGANRPRTLDNTITLYLTSLAVWLLWLPVFLACGVLYPDLPPPVTCWGIMTVIYGIAMLFLASLEPRSPSRRLRAFLNPIPRAPLRWLTLPFQGGAIPGYLLGLLLCLFGLCLLAGRLSPVDEDFTAGVLACFGIVVCYAIFYTALSMALQRRFKFSAGATYAVFFAVGALATFCDAIADGAGSFFGLVTGAFFMEGLDTDPVNLLFLLVGLAGLLVFTLTNLKPFLRETAGTP